MPEIFLKSYCKNEIRKMKKVFDKLKVLNSNRSKGVKEILQLAKSYFEDSKYFLGKKDFVRAFESIVISWAYIDAGLHMKIFKVPAKMKKYFTID